MADLTFYHSEEWLEKLTCPLQELSTFEREAIAKHILVCSDCHRIVADFAVLPWLLEALPTTELPPGLPPKLLHLWQEEDRNSIQSSAGKGLYTYLPRSGGNSSSSEDVSFLNSGDDLLGQEHARSEAHPIESTPFERLIGELME